MVAVTLLMRNRRNFVASPVAAPVTPERVPMAQFDLSRRPVVGDDVEFGLHARCRGLAGEPAGDFVAV
jgi:hypothetical protein